MGRPAQTIYAEKSVLQKHEESLSHFPLSFAVQLSSIDEHHKLEITGPSFHSQIFGFNPGTPFLSGITEGNDWDKLL